jgi:hypothetical protein
VLTGFALPLQDCELFEVNSVFITARGRRIDDSAWNNIEEVIFYLEIGRGTCKFDSQGECISDLHIWPTVQFESTYERVHRFRATAKDGKLSGTIVLYHEYLTEKQMIRQLNLLATEKRYG